jgi:predicted enzyme related to lactoylglutathione lyase
MSVALNAVTFDCADAAGLAEFWSGVLERPVDAGASEQFAAIGADAGSAGGAAIGPAWMFIQVPEGKQVKNRVHVDLGTGDLPAEAERVLKLGASRIADHEEGGVRWITLADPEGNEFDIAQD